MQTMSTMQNMGADELRNTVIKKKKRSAVIFTVFCSFMCVFAVVFLISGISKLFSDNEVYDIEDTEYEDIKEDTVYYFDKMELVDVTSDTKYVYTDTSSNSDSYIVRFKDKNGELCYIFISVDYADEIKSTCDQYMEDESKQPGDVYISGCFSGYSHTLSGSKYDYWQNELPGEAVNMKLDFVAESASDYIQDKKTEATAPIVVGSVIIVIFLLLIVFIWHNVKKAGSMTAVPGSVLAAKVFKQKNKCFVFLALAAVCLVIFITGAIILASDESLGGAMLFLGVFGMIMFIALYSSTLSLSRSYKMVTEILPTEDALASELDRAYYVNGDFRCTPQLLVFPGGIIVPKYKIVWMYVRKQKAYGIITVNRFVIINTADTKTLSIPLGDEASEMIYNDMIRNTINALAPITALGYSPEARLYYKNYKKQYKQNKRNNQN